MAMFCLCSLNHYIYQYEAKTKATKSSNMQRKRGDLPILLKLQEWVTHYLRSSIILCTRIESKMKNKQ